MNNGTNIAKGIGSGFVATEPPRFRGAIFATGAWLVMMIVMMPMAGAELFGLHLGMMAPLARSFCTGSMGPFSAGSMEPGRILSTRSRHAR